MRVTSMELPIGTADDDQQLRLLVERARAGSQTAFSELAKRLWGRITGWGVGITGDRDEAEDVAQLVLLRLHAQVDAFEGRSRFTSWVYRITRNIALDRRMQHRRRAELLATHLASEGADGAAPDASEATSANERAALARLVAAHARALTPRQREVFDAVDLKGESIGEVAERLGVEAVTVRVLLSRARRTIRLRMLEEHPRLLAEYSE